MYEDLSFDKILQRMLSRVANNIDKREGSIIYDALAPAAIELLSLYLEADTILNETFADTASREYLILRAKERGLSPNSATSAVMKGIAKPTTVDVPIGARFNLEGYNYFVTGKYTDSDGNAVNGAYLLESETTGTSPSYMIGQTTPIDFIDGLISFTITDCIIAGEDEEDTEAFRRRYLESLTEIGSGGNVAWYKQTVNQLYNVGATKVFRATNINHQVGGNVTLRILDGNFSVPDTDDLKNQVQTIIDPTVNNGEGLGLAPIGHTVIVLYASPANIDININITYVDGWNWEDVKDDIFDIIDDYLLELRKEWEDSTSLTVRISQIESRLLDLDGILDVDDTKINGNAENQVLGEIYVPIRGLFNGHK